MRKPRHLKPDAIYHVTARINRRAMELAPPFIKELFISILKRSATKYAFELFAWAVMDNHIHLLIHPLNGSPLPNLMRWILSVFALSFNRMMGISGHLWHDRYRSTIINGTQHFYRTFFYIANNPVRAGLSGTADGFRFSHIRDILEGCWGITQHPGQRIANQLKLLCELCCPSKVRRVLGFYHQKPGRKKVRLKEESHRDERGELAR
jgi:putative transposase